MRWKGTVLILVGISNGSDIFIYNVEISLPKVI